VSAIGSITLDGAGNFTMTEFVFNNGKATTSPAHLKGTYSLGTTCTITLKFTGSDNNAIPTPSSFNALLVSNTGSGLISVTINAPQPLNFETGVLIPQ
jgi:hypothetical protein